jgi:hypothetical protein
MENIGRVNVEANEANAIDRTVSQVATGGPPIALTVPVTINSSLVHEGDEIRVCLTMTDTGKVDCEFTVITSYNIEGFPKSVPLEAGGSVGQQIEEITK